MPICPKPCFGHCSARLERCEQRSACAGYSILCVNQEIGGIFGGTFIFSFSPMRGPIRHKLCCPIPAASTNTRDPNRSRLGFCCLCLGVGATSSLGLVSTALPGIRRLESSRGAALLPEVATDRRNDASGRGESRRPCGAEEVGLKFRVRNSRTARHPRPNAAASAADETADDAYTSLAYRTRESTPLTMEAVFAMTLEPDIRANSWPMPAIRLPRRSRVSRCVSSSAPACGAQVRRIPARHGLGWTRCRMTFRGFWR